MWEIYKKMKTTILVIFLLIIIFIFSTLRSKNYGMIFHTKNSVVSKGDTEKTYPPYSSFKMVLSLFLSENSKIKNWKWNGKKHIFPSWNKNQNEKSWIENSCVWVSEDILKKTNLEKIKSFLEVLKYGNNEVDLSNFWLNGKLKISVKNQIEVIKKLLKNKSFNRELFRIKESKNYIIYGKTGTGEKSGGCFVGWVEMDKKEFPFAYYDEKSTGKKAKQKVLENLKILFKE
ncbi:MAG: penicillin-binding transpeptidase domain-containing protein [Alphaproteobacteria bacterium]